MAENKPNGDGIRVEEKHYEVTDSQASNLLQSLDVLAREKSEALESK